MTGIVIPDGGTIGSASDTDALTITNTGVVKASQSIATGTIKDATGANNSISIATNGEATFAENIKITANKGINFSVYGSEDSSSLTTISSNLLDDFEEGSWNPHLKTNSGGAATTTYFSGTGNTYGRYQKVGNICHAQFKLHINNIGDGNQQKLHGLPFNSANLSTVQTGVCSYFSSLASSQAWLAFYIETSATTAYFIGTSAGSSGTTNYSASTTVNNAPLIFQNSTTVYGAISYFTA